MKRINFLLFCIICTISVSCQNKPFDLATIKLGDDVEKYHLEKNGVFEKDIYRSSGNLISYVSVSTKGLTFEEIPTDTSYYIWLTVIDNKIAKIDININEEYTLQFAKKLLAELGTPTAIFTDRTGTKPEISQQIFNKVHSVFPDSTRWLEEPEPLYTFKYPYLLFWDKNGIYYTFSISIDYDGEMRNIYHAITKEAYSSGKLPPLPKNSPVFKYMNK